MRKLPGSTKVWIFLIGLSLLVMLLCYYFAGRVGLFFGFFATISLHILIFYYGESPILRFFDAQLIKGQDAWGLQSILRQQSMRLQIPRPFLYLTESEDVFAFSMGHNGRRGSICVSRGLLYHLSPAEVEAVIAYQICHIQRLNSFIFGVAQMLTFSLIGVGQILDKILFPVERIQNKIRQPITHLISPVAWFFIKFVLNNNIFYENDEMASQLIKDRHFLAEAIWKMNGISSSFPLELPPCCQHFFMVNPIVIPRSRKFLSAHPNIDLRIKKLIGYYPL